MGGRSTRGGLGRRRLLGRRGKSEEADRVDLIRVVHEGTRVVVAAFHPNRNIYLRTTIYIVVNLLRVDWYM